MGSLWRCNPRFAAASWAQSLITCSFPIENDMYIFLDYFGIIRLIYIMH